MEKYILCDCEKPFTNMDYDGCRLIYNCFNFHLEKLTETTFKIISIFKCFGGGIEFPEDSSDFETHKDRIKDAYSREWRYKSPSRFPTKESWNEYVDNSMKIGGILEVKDGIPQIYYWCDNESSIYSKYYEEAHWSLISYDTIDEIDEILEDFEDTETILKELPKVSLEIPELVEDFKLTFISFKQKEIKLKAFDYFLKNAKLSFKYNLQHELSYF
jgi:hypothetical protein